MKKILSFALIVFMLNGFGKAQSQTEFDGANALYNQGKYKEALQIYGSLTEKYPQEYKVWYNLGNAAFKTGNIGASIAAYRKALKLNPLDADVKNNLEFVFQKTADKMEPPSKSFVVLLTDKVAGYLSSGAWAFITLLISVFACLFFMMYIFIRNYRLKKIGLFSSVLLWILAFSAFAMAAHRYYYTLDSDVVITASSVHITGEPTENGTRLILLHEGATLKWKGGEGEWFKVQLPNGTLGYIKNADAVLI